MTDSALSLPPDENGADRPAPVGSSLNGDVGACGHWTAGAVHWRLIQLHSREGRNQDAAVGVAPRLLSGTVSAGYPGGEQPVVAVTGSGARASLSGRTGFRPAPE